MGDRENVDFVVRNLIENDDWKFFQASPADVARILPASQESRIQEDRERFSQLPRRSTLLSSAILALAWASWHLPLWWIAHVPSSLPIYVLGMIPLTILFTWLDDCGKGSVMVALLFHASLNTSLVRLPVFPAILIVNGLYWVVAVVVVVSRGRAWITAPHQPDV